MNARIRNKKIKYSVKHLKPGDVAVFQFDPDRIDLDMAYRFFENSASCLPEKTAALLLPTGMYIKSLDADELMALCETLKMQLIEKEVPSVKQ